MYVQWLWLWRYIVVISERPLLIMVWNRVNLYFAAFFTLFFIQFFNEESNSVIKISICLSLANLDLFHLLLYWGCMLYFYIEGWMWFMNCLRALKSIMATIFVKRSYLYSFITCLYCTGLISQFCNQNFQLKNFFDWLYLIFGTSNCNRFLYAMTEQLLWKNCSDHHINV